MVDYNITDTVLTIYNSHTIGKFHLMNVLKQIKNERPDSYIWSRCLSSLYLETICHNFLYTIGYQKDRTKDVDLDVPCDKPE